MLIQANHNYLGISPRYFHSNKIYLNKKSIYLVMEEKVRERKRKNAMKMMDESRRKTRGVNFDPAEAVRSLRDER